MKKTIILCLALVLLSACSNSNNTLNKEHMDRYQSFWTVIEDQESYLSESTFYSIKASYEDGKYAVTINNARVAMMNIEVVIIENNSVFDSETIMPSSGIFEEALNLIPNQSKEESNFRSEIQIGRESSLPQKLNVLVQWRSLSTNEIHREIFEFNLAA